MAAAVLPTAVGPTMTMTVGWFNSLCYLLFRRAGIFPFFFIFLFAGLFFRRVSAVLFFYAKANRTFRKVLFLFYFRKLVSYQPFCTVLRQRNACWIDYIVVVHFAILFF